MTCARNQRGWQTALLYHALQLNPRHIFDIPNMAMGSHRDSNKPSFQGFCHVFGSDPDRAGKLQQQVKGKAAQIQSEIDFSFLTACL